MISYEQIAIRIAIAAVYGALIGLERERKNWSAGMRTHMMVCVGACLFMIVSAFGFSDILGTENFNLDPSRIAAQVVSGIGFIGAGTILFLKQGAIRGLTTAAGLWTVAAIGLATGGGMYFAAGITTVLAITILWALQPIEKILTKKYKKRTLNIITSSTRNSGNILNELLAVDPEEIYDFSLEKQDGNYLIQLTFEKVDLEKIEGVIEILNKHPDVSGIYWAR